MRTEEVPSFFMKQNKFYKINPERIENSVPTYCFKCKERKNMIIIESKPFNKKVIQYLVKRGVIFK